MATEITSKEQFDAFVAWTDKLVLIDFWAERCGPCRMLKPVLHDISEKRDDVELLTVDVDNEGNQDLTMQFAVRSIPQVTMFKWGAQVEQFVWALPPEQVEELINKHTSNDWWTTTAEAEQESQEQESESE